MSKKLDVWNMVRPERSAETKTFAKNGEELSLTFRKADAADMSLAAEVCKRLVEDFITGSEIREAAGFFDGIKVSEALFMTAAIAQEIQPPDAPVSYTAEEFVILSDRRPDDWVDVQRLIRAQAKDWLSAGPK